MTQLPSWRFILIGSFPERSHSAPLSDRIRAAGGRVLTPRARSADFVVAGINSDPFKLPAVRSGAQVILLGDLELMLSPHFDADRDLDTLLNNPEEAAEILAAQRLPLGFSDGDPVELDLTSGNVFDRIDSPLTGLPTLPYAAVTLDTISDLLRRVQLNPRADEDGNTFVDLLDDTVAIRVDGPWMRLWKSWEINPYVPSGPRFEAINALHLSCDAVRFFMPRPDRLVADRMIDIGGGLVPGLLVDLLQGFVLIVQSGVRGCAEVERLG